ncbi:helix-turn-helix transcriptional regulator [Clostridium sporogenes]|uniref:helix-turn-helix domain-containing protein n=1 Tax=Clostridium sporogenes TaxID=1509 RepID=UPI0013D1F6A2|nr:helix-turn-helix domain-containing protein [Clostridium sporogenes]NFH34541.1 helix-turn-helix transcriptional regulator [Clostridium sporogenes]NFL21949.1 helix-turn-helix transcriptional regulator [Clostridium sporogenes]NFN74567.1 helix-turn-helix transcriptional regulator [Clostridium sporogenes]NFV23999.1 helix-turn-helix transcriptional regulator [Clostridium sporogenes]
MKFYEKLKEYREENNLTQTDFSKKLGISRSQLAMIECGKRPMPVITRKKLSEVTGKSLKWWVDKTEYDQNSYEDMTALSMLLDYMIEKNIIKSPQDIDKELPHITKILKEEVKIKLKKYHNLESKENQDF